MKKSIRFRKSYKTGSTIMLLILHRPAVIQTDAVSLFFQVMFQQHVSNTKFIYTFLFFYRFLCYTDSVSIYKPNQL